MWLLAPFLGVGALVVAMHTLIAVSRTPSLRIHIPIGLLAYFLIFSLSATGALVLERQFEASGATRLGLALYPPLPWFTPLLFSIPSALATAITAIAGTHLYARSRLSSRSARLSVAALVLAAGLAGLTVLIVWSIPLSRFII